MMFISRKWSPQQRVSICSFNISVVVVPASVQKLPHLDFQIQIVVVPVKADILLRVLFQVIKLTPVVDVTPIGLLFLCFRICQADILRVSILVGHNSVALHKSFRMVHEVVPSALLVEHCILALSPTTKDRHHAHTFPAESDVPGVDRALIHWREACRFNQRWKNVHKLNHLVRHRWAVNPRHPDHERRPVRNLKVCLLVPLGMLSQLKPMVTNEEDHCVLCQTKLIELTQYPSYLLVSKANTGIVGSSDLKGLGVMEGYIWKAEIWYALPFRRTIREVENPCGSSPSYVWEVLWNIGISGQANYILRVEIIELSWTIPRLMRLVKSVSNKEVLFSK